MGGETRFWDTGVGGALGGGLEGLGLGFRLRSFCMAASSRVRESSLVSSRCNIGIRLGEWGGE